MNNQTKIYDETQEVQFNLRQIVDQETLRLFAECSELIGESRDKAAYDAAHEILDEYVFSSDTTIWEMMPSAAATIAGEKFCRIEAVKDLLGFVDANKYA